MLKQHFFQPQVHLVTQSLFPPFSISCEPICAAAVTARRLMAGYVLYHSGDDVATILYGELSPHTRGSDLARLAFYENEQCQRLAMEIWLSVASNCFEKVGVSCTCFCINGHDFSARTMAERKFLGVFKFFGRVFTPQITLNHPIRNDEKLPGLFLWQAKIMYFLSSFCDCCCEALAPSHFQHEGEAAECCTSTES